MYPALLMACGRAFATPIPPGMIRFRNPSAADPSRVRIEDALKHVLDCGEAGRAATVDSLAGALAWPRDQAATTLAELRAGGLASADGDGHRLSDEGRRYALRVVRGHRLYETFLARETGTPPEHWHREAHKAEHELGEHELDALAERLNQPRFDPHGDPIPTREGHLPRRALESLAAWPDGRPARIEHLEDEPESLFRQARALGLAPGMRLLQARHLANGAVECLVEGRQLTVPAALAPLVHLSPGDPDDTLPAGLGRLSDLAPGGEAIVHALAPSCTGLERLRLLDLGVVPGTRIRCEFASPFGSPRSYRLRGALVALRDHQAERILIHPPEAVP